MCEALKFNRYKKSDIQWREMAPDDFIAEIRLAGSTYTLRVEQMDKKSWWACFYINQTQQWDNSGEYATSGNAAKRQVLQALNKYRERC